ncbi:hypothetical protein [Actinoplanes sp. G11-F43]|uniref:hypothetical protein n=1 Tax=Actinoplanes sp. G11-F43 TaxID=3424130 RepID=UPI003D34D15F
MAELWQRAWVRQFSSGAVGAFGLTVGRHSADSEQSAVTAAFRDLDEAERGSDHWYARVSGFGDEAFFISTPPCPDGGR